MNLSDWSLFQELLVLCVGIIFHVCLRSVAMAFLKKKRKINKLEKKKNPFSGLTLDWLHPSSQPSLFLLLLLPPSWLCCRCMNIRTFHLEQLRSHNLNPIVHLCPVFKLYGRLLLFFFFLLFSSGYTFVCGMSVRSKGNKRRNKICASWHYV